MAIPDKKWSDMCEENINKYDTITMCCTCQNRECSYSHHNKFYGAITFDYYSYISALSLSAEDSYSQIDCPECKAHKSLHVYGTMDDLIDEVTNSSF